MVTRAAGGWKSRCWRESVCIFLFHPLGILRSQTSEPLRAVTGLTWALLPQLSVPGPCQLRAVRTQVLATRHAALHGLEVTWGLLLAWPSSDLSQSSGLAGHRAGWTTRPTSTIYLQPPLSGHCLARAPVPHVGSHPPLPSTPCALLGALSGPAPQESKGALRVVFLKVP